MKPSCTSESSIKERQRSSLRQKVGRSIISSHCQTSRQHTGESAQDASWKVGRIEILVASLHSRDHIWPKDILSTESRLLISKKRNRDEDRPAIGAVSRGRSEKKQQRKCQTLLLERRLHSFDHTRAVHLDKHAHSNDPNKKKQREGMTSFTFSDSFTAPKFERRWKR